MASAALKLLPEPKCQFLSGKSSQEPSRAINWQQLNLRLLLQHNNGRLVLDVKKEMPKKPDSEMVKEEEREWKMDAHQVECW